jgi:putative DNA primase/helicase
MKFVNRPPAEDEGEPVAVPRKAAANGNGKSNGHAREDVPPPPTDADAPPRAADDKEIVEPISLAGLPVGVVQGSDLSTACLLTEYHSRDLLYCVEYEKWLAWDGKRYQLDAFGDVSLRVQRIARGIERKAEDLFSRAAESNSEEAAARMAAKAKALLVWAKHAQSASGIRAALTVAQTHMPCSIASLDKDAMLLNVENGTLDLRTGTLREHDRGDRITKLAPVAFDVAATATRFEAFVVEVLPDDEVRAFVQRFLGYTLTGLTSEQLMMVALGEGNNGKSVLAELVRSILGDYAGNLPSSALMMSKHGRGTENEIARLKGARFVTAKETEQEKRLDEARVKDLTGADTITARFLFKEWFDFKPSFKLWFYSNYKPKIRGTDLGIWRRIALVLFGVIVPLERRDKDLLSKLQAEAPGVLNWLVAGCSAWLAGGLAPPDAVIEATAQWRGESDVFGQFLTERCERAPYKQVTAAALYTAYTSWFATEGLDPHTTLSKIAVGLELERLGIEPFRTRSGARGWRGVTLVVEAPPPPEDDGDGFTGGDEGES